MSLFYSVSCTYLIVLNCICCFLCAYSIPTVTNGDIAIYATEIYHKETAENPQRIVFSKFDATELDSLFTPGTFVDAFFSLDVYDYQQSAGIRLVAKKLIIHSSCCTL